MPLWKFFSRHLGNWELANREKGCVGRSGSRGYAPEKREAERSWGRHAKRYFWWIILFLVMPGGASLGGEQPAFEDYCARLEQEIQGRKHGFMAGNLSYYVGGFHASWELVEDETIGLTHPFHHDLRSRGVGLLESQLEGSEHTGLGNDYQGWEFIRIPGFFTAASSLTVGFM